MSRTHWFALLAASVALTAVVAVGLLTSPKDDVRVPPLRAVPSHDLVAPAELRDLYGHVLDTGRRWCLEQRAFDASVRAGVQPIDSQAPSYARQFNAEAAEYDERRPWVSRPVQLPVRAPTLEEMMAQCPAPTPIDDVHGGVRPPVRPDHAGG